MSKIKYLVMGIENEPISNIIGMAVAGEVQGPASVIVLPFQVPKVFALLGNSVKEVSFAEFLSSTIQTERKNIEAQSNGEKLVQNIVRLESKGRPEIA